MALQSDGDLVQSLAARQSFLGGKCGSPEFDDIRALGSIG